MNVALYYRYREHEKHGIGKTMYKSGTFTTTKLLVHASGEVIVNGKNIRLHKDQMDLLN